MKLVDVDRILKRYLHDNIPIKTCELRIDIENKESASVAEKLIRNVATNPCLKELSLKICIYGTSLHLPDEILSSETLTKIRVSVPTHRTCSFSLTTTNHPKCVSLRELHLCNVHISEELLHNILSSCSLLVKIELLQCRRNLKTIKVKNLPCLEELRMSRFGGRGSTGFEISHVENLRLLTCDVLFTQISPLPLINRHSISLGSRVTELTLGEGVITDNASMKTIIKSGLPFLESCTLDMTWWTLGSFHFKCASIKSLSLLGCPLTLVNVVHVQAPKLLFFKFDGRIMPSLSFPDSTLEQIRFSLQLKIGHVDATFFLKMREALMLSSSSSECEVFIEATFDDGLPLHIDIDDLRTRLPFPPSRNVQKLLFNTRGDECLWERSPFFDAFFEICHRPTK